MQWYFITDSSSIRVVAALRARPDCFDAAKRRDSVGDDAGVHPTMQSQPPRRPVHAAQVLWRRSRSEARSCHCPSAITSSSLSNLKQRCQRAKGFPSSRPSYPASHPWMMVAQWGKLPPTSLFCCPQGFQAPFRQRVLDMLFSLFGGIAVCQRPQITPSSKAVHQTFHLFDAGLQAWRPKRV